MVEIATHSDDARTQTTTDALDLPVQVEDITTGDDLVVSDLNGLEVKAVDKEGNTEYIDADRFNRALGNQYLAC